MSKKKKNYKRLNTFDGDKLYQHKEKTVLENKNHEML